MKLLEYLKLIRIINGIMIATGVCIGYLLTIKWIGRDIIIDELVLGILTGLFINSSVMVINDIIDLKVDMINSPNRPLPSGKISVIEAYILAILLGLAGILTSVITGYDTFSIALSFFLLGIVYNKYLKGIPLIGNLAVSASVAIPFIYGGILAAKTISVEYVWILASAAFFINTYREIIKDIADIEGDKQNNLVTLPIILGIDKSLIISHTFLGIGLIIGWTPLIVGKAYFNLTYIIMMILASASLLYSLHLSKKYNDKNSILKSKNIALLGMLMGMMAFSVI